MIDYSKKAVNGIIPKEHLFQGPLVGKNTQLCDININWTAEWYKKIYYKTVMYYFTLFHTGKITKIELAAAIYIWQQTLNYTEV